MRTAHVTVLLALVPLAGCQARSRGRDDGDPPTMSMTFPAADGSVPSAPAPAPTAPPNPAPPPTPTPSPGGTTCGGSPYPTPDTSTHRRCSAGLSACLAAAADDGARRACLTREPDSCLDCAYTSQLHCATTGACREALTAWQCCVEPRCPSADPNCIATATDEGGPCAQLTDDLLACTGAETRAGRCPNIDPICVATAPAPTPAPSPPPPLPPSTGGPCSGAASASGLGVPVQHAYVHEDNGGIGIFMTNTPSGAVPVGERALIGRLAPISGQWSYPPTSGLFNCGVAEKTSTGWRGVTAGICEITVTTLVYATATGTCDGRFAGAYRGLFGSEVLAGAFDAPMPIAMSEINGSSCRPTDGACSDDSQCCSGSCWRVIGACH